eukprot:15430533-Alexandrium_andersonii.AAC.1
MFGWVGGTLGRQAGVGILHPRFVHDVIAGAGVPVIDWFRRAQERKEWRGMIRKVFPLPSVERAHWDWLDAWRPGGGMRDSGVRGRGATAEQAGEGGEAQRFACPVCTWVGRTGNSLAHHFDTTHGVRNPEVVTLTAQRCDQCMVFFPNRDQLRAQECAAKREREAGGPLARTQWGPCK